MSDFKTTTKGSLNSLAPSGWPNAIAPPFGLTLSKGIPRVSTDINACKTKFKHLKETSFVVLLTWLAKASLIYDVDPSQSGASAGAVMVY